MHNDLKKFSCIVHDWTISTIVIMCFVVYGVLLVKLKWWFAFSTKFNQSINLFVQMQNKHWTGHQGRMQPPLTGAHKKNVSKSNKRQYFTEKKNLVDRKMSHGATLVPRLYEADGFNGDYDAV